MYYGEVYSIQHYVIKYVSDFRQVSGFLWFPPPIKLIAMIVDKWQIVDKHHKPKPNQ
jgi:hypothetical protein